MPMENSIAATAAHLSPSYDPTFRFKPPDFGLQVGLPAHHRYRSQLTNSGYRGSGRSRGAPREIEPIS